MNKPQMESCWSLGYDTAHPSHTVWSVCVPGFQGAGNSSHRHDIPHWFLLLCQLCEGWHSGDAGAWLFWLSSGGKTPHPNFSLRKMIHSTMLKNGNEEIENASLKCFQKWMNCVYLSDTGQRSQGSWLVHSHCSFIEEVFLSVHSITLRLAQFACGMNWVEKNILCGCKIITFKSLIETIGPLSLVLWCRFSWV